MYFMMCGTFPFDGKTHPEIMLKIKNEPMQPMEGFQWTNISSLAKDLIKKLLVKDPKKRLTPS